jgi:rSAM/selenodomain-associated transferase 1
MPAETNCAIAVMAKAPRPGRVKTRLVPPLTPEAASALSAAFLRDITENIVRAGRDAAIQGYIAYAPAGFEGLFDGILAAGTRLVLADGAGDWPRGVEGFGRCLLHAVEALFARGHQSVCLLNSDSPTLPTTLLSQATRALAAPGDRVVLGPAEDGGYYLIGVKAPHAHLFAEIAWSTEHVADQTRERAQTLGLELVELATWYDVDDRAALSRLFGELAGRAPSGLLTPYPAPATAAALQRLDLANALAADAVEPLCAVPGRNP